MLEDGSFAWFGFGGVCGFGFVLFGFNRNIHGNIGQKGLKYN